MEACFHLRKIKKGSCEFIYCICDRTICFITAWFGFWLFPYNFLTIVTLYFTL